MQNQRNTNRSKLSSSLEIRVISASCSSWAFWRSLARALESSNSCMFGSFTRLGHVGSFRRPLHTCMIMIDHAPTMNLQNIVIKSLDVVIACPNLCHSAIGHCCETGNNLTVLRKLGLLCFAFFLQTAHSCNLFAAFVALLHKPRETSASQSKR